MQTPDPTHVLKGQSSCVMYTWYSCTLDDSIHGGKETRAALLLLGTSHCWLPAFHPSPSVHHAPMPLAASRFPVSRCIHTSMALMDGPPTFQSCAAAQQQSYVMLRGDSARQSWDGSRSRRAHWWVLTCFLTTPAVSFTCTMCVLRAIALCLMRRACMALVLSMCLGGPWRKENQVLLPTHTPTHTPPCRSL